MQKYKKIKKSEILKNLGDNDYKFIIKGKVSSTNDLAKKLKNKERKTVILSESQTSGRGRFDRTFYSPKGFGIYLSFLCPLNLPMCYSSKITPFVGLVVAKVLERLTGLKTQIKWVNDVILNNKKVAGILCESKLENGMIKYVVLGIGINVLSSNFPNEIKEIATSIEDELKLKIDRNLIIAEILKELGGLENSLKNLNFYSDYKQKLNLLDKCVKVASGGETYIAKVLDLNENFELEVLKEDKKITLSSGDVSVKIN